MIHPVIEPSADPQASAEMLHRVANTLAILVAGLRAERRRVEDPAARAALDGAAARIQAAAALNRRLYALPPDGRVDLPEFLRGLAEALGDSLGMACTVVGDGVSVSGRTAEALGVAMVELAINALKHGYDGGRAPGLAALEARVAEGADGWVWLTVSDRGRGLPAGFAPEASTGLGLRIVRSAVGALGGCVRAEDGDGGGARFVLAAPAG